jgi:hypothetical protein
MGVGRNRRSRIALLHEQFDRRALSAKPTGAPVSAQYAETLLRPTAYCRQHAFGIDQTRLEAVEIFHFLAGGDLSTHDVAAGIFDAAGDHQVLGVAEVFDL